MKFLLHACASAAVILASSPSFAAPKVLNNCQTIVEPGAYVVGKNIAASGDCFVIAADNVNLDFDGFVLTGNGTGSALGIAYPPALLFLVAIVVLVFKALFGDIELTRVRRDLRRLNQRIALLEAGHRTDEELDSPATNPVTEAMRHGDE